MGDFLKHLKETKWLDLNAWFCACCCPCYIFQKISYEKLKDDSYRLPVVACCPCTLAFWYMVALDKIDNTMLNRALACGWTYCCGVCAFYVAAQEDGVKVKDELNNVIKLAKRVVTIDRS